LYSQTARLPEQKWATEENIFLSRLLVTLQFTTGRYASLFLLVISAIIKVHIIDRNALLSTG